MKNTSKYLWIPIVWSNLYYILLKANFFILQRLHVFLLVMQNAYKPQTAAMSMNIVLPGNYMWIWIAEWHISYPRLIGQGFVYFQALKSCEKATKPVYVSPGHKISIDSATELVHRCSKYRVPEPIRQVNPKFTDSDWLWYCNGK